MGALKRKISTQHNEDKTMTKFTKLTSDTLNINVENEKHRAVKTAPAGEHRAISVSAFGVNTGATVTAQAENGRFITIKLSKHIVDIIRNDIPNHFENPKHHWGCFSVADKIDEENYKFFCDGVIRECHGAQLIEDKRSEFVEMYDKYVRRGVAPVDAYDRIADEIRETEFCVECDMTGTGGYCTCS